MAAGMRGVAFDDAAGVVGDLLDSAAGQGDGVLNDRRIGFAFEIGPPVRDDGVLRDGRKNRLRIRNHFDISPLRVFGRDGVAWRGRGDASNAACTLSDMDVR